jgi:hypothetical protein
MGNTSFSHSKSAPVTLARVISVDIRGRNVNLIDIESNSMENEEQNSQNSAIFEYGNAIKDSFLVTTFFCF